MHLPRLALLLLLPAILAGCQPRPADRPGAPTTQMPSQETWPQYDYPGAVAAGLRVDRLVAERSLIDVVVRRDGPLARFGHDHVISVRDLEGFLLFDADGSPQRVELRFPLASLVVDDVAGRRRYQLDTDPDASAIEGTRNNLMQHVLDPQDWPFATVQATDFDGLDGQLTAALAIGISGAQHSSRHPFILRLSPETTSAEGTFVLRQTALGLQPFSALGGGLQVADEMEIHLRLEGQRVQTRD